MITHKIQAIFDFIDFLDHNKREYIDEYIPICNTLIDLFNQKNKLNPTKNYQDKQKNDDIQTQIEELSSPITLSIVNPIKCKLEELGIWQGDETYASIWNGNYSEIHDFKENFSPEDVPIIMDYKEKYISFRKETKTDFLFLKFAFASLDEILKELFDFFKNSTENEFESFEARTIEVKSFKEIIDSISNDTGENVKYSIPTNAIMGNDTRKPTSNNPNTIKTDIIMGDNIQIGAISNDSGQVSIGKENTLSNKDSNEITKKSFKWQKWGIIIAIVTSIIIIALMIIFK